MQVVEDFFLEIHPHRVERDMLGVAESEIELPSWI
jgi:hypothetical protein